MKTGLENEAFLVEVDNATGSITRILVKADGYELIAEPRLGGSFALLLPLEGREDNYVEGADQERPEIEHGATSIVMRWAGPLRNARGAYDVPVRARIELAPAELVFRIEVENGWTGKVAEVLYPILGGMRGAGRPATRGRTRFLVPDRYSQWDQDVFTRFGTTECLGCLGAEHLFNYPSRMSMPWCCFYNTEEGHGLYFAVHDPAVRSTTLRLEMSPGLAHQRSGGDWPTEEELKGGPAGITAHWTFFPHSGTGESFKSPSIVLLRHEGDWRNAAQIYRGWFAATFPLPKWETEWIKRETTWLDTMFLFPEGTTNLTFADIPRWAEGAVRYGIRTVLISGWSVGGHDRGYPAYEPDPRLGTWEQLREGVHACHKLGLRVLFFVNIKPVDMTTDWYRRELHRYVVQDPWGLDYGPHGWGMGTISARMGATRVPLAYASPGFPEFRAIIVRHMKHLAEIGADGVHIDKATVGPLDFNPALPAAPDRSTAAGLLTCMREILDACRGVNPEFCVSYEGWWDRLMSCSGAVWWSMGYSVMKAVFPEWAPFVGVTQPWDFNVVNLAVLHGHNLLVGPAHYSRSIEYEPMGALAAYIGEITRIRSELFDVLLMGDLLESSHGLFSRRRPTPVVGGTFARAVESSADEAQWSLFAKDGTRALVLANLSRRELSAEGVVPGKTVSGEGALHAPFQPRRQARFPAAVRILPEQVVVVTGGGA